MLDCCCQRTILLPSTSQALHPCAFFGHQPCYIDGKHFRAVATPFSPPFRPLSQMKKMERKKKKRTKKPKRSLSVPTFDLACLHLCSASILTDGFVRFRQVHLVWIVVPELHLGCYIFEDCQMRKQGCHSSLLTGRQDAKWSAMPGFNHNSTQVTVIGFS